MLSFSGTCIFFPELSTYNLLCCSLLTTYATTHKSHDIADAILIKYIPLAVHFYPDYIILASRVFLLVCLLCRFLIENDNLIGGKFVFGGWMMMKWIEIWSYGSVGYTRHRENVITQPELYTEKRSFTYFVFVDSHVIGLLRTWFLMKFCIASSILPLAPLPPLPTTLQTSMFCRDEMLVESIVGKNSKMIWAKHTANSSK